MDHSELQISALQSKLKDMAARVDALRGYL